MRKIKKYLKNNNKGRAVSFKRSSHSVLGILQALEPRILYDAAVGAELAAAAHSAAAAHVADADVAAHSQVSNHVVDTLIHEQTTDASHVNSTHTLDTNNSFDNSHATSLDNGYQSFDKTLVKEVIFVDQNVKSYTDLLKGVDLNKLISGELEIVILKDNTSGVAQITNYLNQFDHQIDTVHIVSQGNSGTAFLGADTLNISTINHYQTELTQWSHSLASGADILFYGCNIGQGTSGQDLVQSLHELTQADIAASSNLTGNSALHGDWNLEVTDGVVTASMAFNTSSLQSYKYTLDTIFVDNNTDIVDGDTSSIANLLLNKGSDNSISLREAIDAANNTPGADIINLIAPGNIVISSTFTLTDNITINQANVLGTTIVTTGPIGPGPYEIYVAPGVQAHLDLNIISQSGLKVLGIDGDGSSVNMNANNPNTLSNTAITINANNVSVTGSFNASSFSGPPLSSPVIDVINGQNININASVNFANNVGIKVEGGQNINITNGHFFANNTSILVANNVNNVTISGNTVEGFPTNNYGIVVQDNANHITITNNSFKNLNVGVAVTNTANDVNITHNTIDNVALPIDLNADGITPNDVGDADTGPNNLQNTPILTAATQIVDIDGLHRYQITGTLNTEANKTYRIDYYANSAPAGHNTEFLGSQTVTTDASGNAILSFIFNNAVGTYISATASEQIIANSVYSTSEVSTSVTLTDSLPAQMNLKDLNNSPGSNSRITSNGTGLVLTGTMNEPTYTFTNFIIRSALDGSTIESGNIGNLTVNPDGTWSYTVQTATLVPGAYFLEATGTDLGNNLVTFTTGESFFAITPAAGDVVPNELGGTVNTSYSGSNTTSLAVSGTLSSAINDVVVVEGNVGDGLNLLLTTTGFFYDSNSSAQTWATISNSGLGVFTQTTPFAQGTYSYTVHIFSATTYDKIISTNNTIVDTTSGSANFNNVVSPSTSAFAATALTGNYADNYFIDSIIFGVAPHSSSNDLNSFSTTAHQLLSPGGDSFLPLVTGSLAGGIGGTFSIDPGQFNLAPGAYDVLLVAVDRAGNMNIVGNTLTEGVNLFSNAITITGATVSNSSNSDSSVVASLINPAPPVSSTPTLDNLTDNGLVINSPQLQQTNEAAVPSTNSIDGTTTNSNESSQPTAQSATPTPTAEQSQTQDQSQTQTSQTQDNNGSGSRIGSSNSNSATSTPGSNNTSSNNSNSSSQPSVANNIATFFVNAAESVTNAVKESANYAKHNPAVAAGTAVAGGILVNSVIATHTVAAAGHAANGVILGTNAIGSTTTSSSLSAATGKRFSLSSFSFNNSKNNQGKFKHTSERPETEKAEEKEIGEDCHCVMCSALHTHGPKANFFRNKKNKINDEQQIV